ncbi:T9SS type A sorting domain-containing protein [Flavobacterium poyangense]|uniref:T9SS type A sorting domain-containing protein n=1 Tax=Flavobacterium poyangense TaxID=2204302 RepID=UPI0014215B67|nr:T9SS type A sorting domain-containing protein [Flavobacterium sp. JXAS1]
MKTKLLLFLLLANFSIYAQVNLVSNGDFENWTNSTTLPHWTAQNNVIQNTADYRGGLNSARLSFVSSALTPKITTQVPMSAGVTYTIRFKYKYLSSNFNTSHPIVLNVGKSGSAATLSTSSFATDNNWTPAESTFTPDQNLSYDLSISLLTFDTIGFNVAIDDVQVYVKGTEKYTLIPDTNFEKKLISLSYDWGIADGKVLTADIASLIALNTTTNIHGPGLSITDLTGIQDFAALTSLDCSGQQITNLNLTKNLALTTLSCYNNQLANLDLSQNKALATINCYYNKLTNLSLPKSDALKSLQCNSNSLTNLDVSANTALSYLNCNDNRITNLDISKNTALTTFYCKNNALTDLNLKNGKNTAFYSNYSYKIDFTSNQYLKCIAVDDVIYSNKNWGKNKDSGATYTLSCDQQYTAIPDLNFEKKLIALWIDSGSPDGKVLTASISSQTTLDVSSSGIADLTGIQGFIKLKSLNCSDSKLSSLDISKNLNLTDLNCSKNQLSSLDVTKHIALTSLLCSNNTEMGLLDVSANANLSVLDCKSTNLTSLDLTQNLKLNELNCSYNSLIRLDLSKNIHLTSLDCSYNRLPNLDVSNHVGLVSLNCSNNYLTSLDLSKNMSLNIFNCSNNRLVNLNAKNGNNLNMPKPVFTGNPDLTCITVDKISYADTNWKNKDKKASYNTSCGTNIAYTTILDPAFEQKLIDIGIDTDGKNGKVMTTSITYVTSLDVSSSNITSLNGIQDFLSLTYLDCGLNKIQGLNLSNSIFLTTVYASNNAMTLLDVSGNRFLTYLDCSKNRLKSLDVSKNKALTYLNLSDNSIITNFTTLDVSNNIALTALNCSYNRIEALDVTKNKALTSLNCFSNRIETLDVSKNTALTKLDCQYNNLWYLDLKNGNNINLDVANSNFKDNPILACIQVDDASYANANWSGKKDALATFNQTCTIPYTLIPDINFENKLIALKIDTGTPDGKIATAKISNITDLSLNSSSISDLTGIEDFTALTYLNCANNLLTTIDISKNVALIELYVSNNKLTTINTSENIALKELYIHDNELKSVDVAKNINLRKLFCWTNKLTVLNVSNNKYLNELRCFSNQLTNLDLSSNNISSINCSDNNLYSLNLKNGFNKWISNDLITVNFLRNPNLKCIQVDDEKYSNEKWADKKDATAVYSSNCSSLGLEETIFDKVTISPNPTKGELNINHVTLEKATVYNALGQLVKTFTLDPSNTNNTINLSGLPRGIYYVYLINQDAASAKKIILE